MAQMADMEEMRRDALAALGEVLRAPDAKPADRLRAAECILRAERDGLATGDLDELDDLALLAIARGQEGGTPPERGPKVPTAATVPSSALAPRSPLLAERENEADPPGLVTPKANPFMRRGPKEDPALGAPRGVPLAMGPKEDPDPWT